MPIFKRWCMHGRCVEMWQFNGPHHKCKQWKLWFSLHKNIIIKYDSKCNAIWCSLLTRSEQLKHRKKINGIICGIDTPQNTKSFKIEWDYRWNWQKWQKQHRNTETGNEDENETDGARAWQRRRTIDRHKRQQKDSKHAEKVKQSNENDICSETCGKKAHHIWNMKIKCFTARKCGIIYIFRFIVQFKLACCRRDRV